MNCGWCEKPIESIKPVNLPLYWRHVETQRAECADDDTNLAHPAQAPAPVRSECKYGDPFCPCQDGDTCHYEGNNPMTAPAPVESGQPQCPTCGEKMHGGFFRVSANSTSAIKWRCQGNDESYHEFIIDCSAKLSQFFVRAGAVDAGGAPGPLCPSCHATDNNPYVDATGVHMRACSRCMIQWRDALSAPMGDAGLQRKIDISNLRFYARMANEFDWHTDIIHKSVIIQTLNFIADTLATDAGGEGTGCKTIDECMHCARKIMKCDGTGMFCGCRGWFHLDTGKGPSHLCYSGCTTVAEPVVILCNLSPAAPPAEPHKCIAEMQLPAGQGFLQCPICGATTGVVPAEPQEDK